MTSWLDDYGALQDLAHDPVLRPRQRPRLLDAHHVADPALVALVVRGELAGPLHRLLVERVRAGVLDRDDHGLVHLVAHHAPDLHQAAALLARLELPAPLRRPG